MNGGFLVESVEQEKSYSKWEWFLYIILLPCLFTLILVGIILTFMKVDVITPLLQLGNRIPIVEKVIPDPKVNSEEDFILYENTFRVQTKDSASSDESTLSPSEEINRYQLELADRETQIQQLKEELKKADEHNKLMESELNRLKSVENQTVASEHKAKIKEIAEMYSAMSASKSAPILSNLENQEATQILSEMDIKKRSQILEKIEPKKAAELSLLLANISESSENTDQLLIERIKQLEKELETNSKSVKDAGLVEAVQSFEVMDRVAAADIFEKMWADGNKKQALDILKKLGTKTFSEILAKMTPETAALITTDIAKAK